MTEEEAKAKVCCGPPQAGERPKGDDRIRCIASACMAWRQLGWVPVDLVRAARQEKGLSFDDAVALVRETVSRESGDHGYCGLAGSQP